jgi:hypothetical protein
LFYHASAFGSPKPTVQHGSWLLGAFAICPQHSGTGSHSWMRKSFQLQAQTHHREFGAWLGMNLFAKSILHHV